MTINYESLGSCGTADRFDGRAMAEMELGVAFLKSYIGEPPAGCSLEIVAHEHELGEYGTICLCWDIGRPGAEEWQYYRQCERALSRLDASVDWRALAEVLWMDSDEDSATEEDAREWEND
jgi:hypothetical protein